MRGLGSALFTIKGTSTTEGIMKKLTTVLIAAGLLVSASACSAQQQLTTKETCDRVNVAAAGGISQNPSRTLSTRAANAVRPIESVASDEMKPVVTAILEYLDEQSKENPNEERMGELTTAFQEAGAKFGQLCTAGQ
ncbi:hypothetical protein StoSoilB3_35640 [Arthrobacter sp. StoSoilB3]|nr:hypothetical protein [Paenarthrobacter nicotinovorans]SKB77745.1 hypothetical protein SAMN05660916_02624 [Arthrobacter sp. 31Cvi3.1E]BCW12224.1 hypothetical protein NtRootA2_35060 [Arthrobacter sp. NtRootA2]BCW16306.1 hypothetical protein NtRootA4_32850 [Arthrobacter sp. NtRootA4]BCW24638.1 hypothetical protein NtRootC7_35050 [Arthrobacter sp. NtRootC7]BCW28909.1 hypothetical protein NtRootC45_35090 [Arthrobacter sp. NtRootC45]BCW33179.1 hypothetical protein NtRootD5_35100 [Arthrobacter sp